MKRKNNQDNILKKVNSFKPDSDYIKDAITDFKKRGGRISKSTFGSGLRENIMTNENSRSEP